VAAAAGAGGGSVTGESISARERAERKRRLDEIFGRLPEQTLDDLDQPNEGRERAAEEWLRRQVPPHHGG